MAVYKIIFQNDTGGGGKLKAVSGQYDSVKNNGIMRTDYAEKMLKNLVSVGTLTHTADQIVSHSLSKISLETGAQEVHQRANFAYGKINSFVKTAAIGGIAGGIPGAIVGSLLNVGQQIFDYAMRYDTIQSEKGLEDISRDLQSRRATTSGRRYSNVTEF